MSDQTQPTDEKKVDSKSATPEEIAAMREKMLKYWEEQLPFLKKQLEFETITADIEEARTRRLEMMLRYAQMSSPPEAPKRKLKEEA